MHKCKVQTIFSFKCLAFNYLKKTKKITSNVALLLLIYTLCMITNIYAVIEIITGIMALQCHTHQCDIVITIPVTGSLKPSQQFLWEGDSPPYYL